jgi:hypothetical protein
MNNQNSQSVYQEYMQHARHAETQRLAFATVFSAIFAALVAYTAKPNNSDTIGHLVFGFLFIFSLFGFFVTSVWSTAFVKFSRLAEYVAVKEFSMESDMQRFSKHNKIISASKIFGAFYSLTVGISVALPLSITLSSILCIAVSSSLSLVLFLCYIFWGERNIKRIDEEHRVKIKEHGCHARGSKVSLENSNVANSADAKSRAAD